VRRREFIAALGGAAAWPVVARGQQSNRVRRVGVLVGFSDTDDLGQDFVRELRKSLTDLGLNIELDLQWGFAGARAKAEQLLSHAPDAIVANGTAMLIASQQVTKTVPIVFMNVSDPVGGGLVQSCRVLAATAQALRTMKTTSAANGWSYLKRGCQICSVHLRCKTHQVHLG
jgi:ABC-type uncharacterized transport system substrate-binding protein